MNKENTRALGTGETIREGDLYEIDGQLLPVEDTAVGEIITGDELCEIRRPLLSDPIEAICQEYGIKTDMGKAALRVAIQNAATLDKKNQDYGSGPIADFGVYGIMVRMWDKTCRLKNLLTNVKDPKNESIEDTFLDLANYCYIAILVMRKLWK